MDNNNFQNNCYGAEPQKPFTDKTNPQSPQFAQPANNFVPPQQETFTPQQPLINKSAENVGENLEVNIPNEDFKAEISAAEPFSPVQNTAQYANSPLHTQNLQQAQSPLQGGYYQAQQQSKPYNDYSQPVYHNGAFSQKGAYSYYDNQQSQQNSGVPNINVPPQYPNNFPYMSQPVQKPKSKANAGLIAIIVVLCVLLFSSLVGIVVYVSVASDNNTKDSYSESDRSFDFTMPDYTLPEDEEEAESYHEESDYTDKADKGYKGLELKNKPKDSDKNSGYSAETAFNKVSDSVVGIVCYNDKVTSVEDCASQGSGIIITKDGYVVTNSHVIGNSKTAYLVQVITSDGKAYDAGIVGFDSRTDIAVLKMDGAKDLSPATFGDSEQIELGEDIIAVGNPGGLDYQNSITKGIVSAVNRELSSTSLVKYIQTDAAINPGNSGGPIVNLYGQVIGIATSKIVSEQYEGMGFAIPSATAKGIIDSLMRNGYVEGRVKIGITGTAIDVVTAEEMGVPAGILVAEVSPDGPCEDSPLQTDDIITEVDGQSITSFADVYEILEQHKAGDKVTIKYYRDSTHSEDEFEITLQEDK